MKTFTDKEVLVLKQFAQASIDCCGGFDEYDQMSYQNARDLAEATGMNEQQIGGIITSLLEKGMVEFWEGDEMVTWPEQYLEHEQLKDFVTNQ